MGWSARNTARREPSRHKSSSSASRSSESSPDPRWRLVRATLGLAALAGVLRLICLSHPAQVVFDEVHMGKFIAAYVGTHSRIFDIHPPHAKLIVSFFAWLGGFNGGFAFEQIGMLYGNVPIFWLRLAPALSGMLIAPLFFWWLTLLGARFPTALLGGLAIALDNAILVETRIIVFDGILLVATLGALVSVLATSQTAGWRRLAWNIAAGVGCGVAVGTKFTGLAVFLLVLYTIAERARRHRHETAYLRRRIAQAIFITAVMAGVYLGGWAIHFNLLTQPGPADRFHQTTGQFWQDFMVTHKTMLDRNIHLGKGHPDASKPWSWPLMKVAPFYWSGDRAGIYLFGNPMVWWGTSCLFLVFLGLHALSRASEIRFPRSSEERTRVDLPLLGWLVSFVPLVLVPRVLFLYHYLTPLIFSLAFVLLWLDRIGWIASNKLRRQRASYFIVSVLIVAGFIAVAPVSYGVPAGGYAETLIQFIRSLR